MGEKKVALVTGAASGIGKATAERLQKDDCRVVFVDKRFDGITPQDNTINDAVRSVVSYFCRICDEKVEITTDTPCLAMAK